MARMIVEAIVAAGMARPGTRDPIPVTISVTNSAGVPITNLNQSNILIGDTWGTQRLVVQGFQGGTMQIGLGATNAGGLYTCELLPIASANWTLWTSYHVVIVVTQGSNHGQTIAELTFPHP